MRAFVVLTASVLLSIAVGVSLIIAVGSTTTSVPVSGALPSSARSVPVPSNLTDVTLLAGETRLFVLGDIGDSFKCEVISLDPSTLRGPTFPLPACPADAFFANGELVIVGESTGPAIPQTESATDTNRFFLMRVNPETGWTEVGPTMLTDGGSADAHVGYAMGGGAIWIAGEDVIEGGEVLVETSPTTGEVLERWKLPAADFDTPIVAADAIGAWVTSLPGGRAPFFHVQLGNSSVSEVDNLSDAIGTLALVARGPSAEALVEVETKTDAKPRDDAARISSEVVQIDKRNVVAIKPDAANGAGWTQWEVEPHGRLTCSSFTVAKVNLALGSSRSIAEVPDANESCFAGDEGDDVTTLGRWLFASPENGGGVYRVVLPAGS